MKLQNLWPFANILQTICSLIYRHFFPIPICSVACFSSSVILPTGYIYRHTSDICRIFTRNKLNSHYWSTFLVISSTLPRALLRHQHFVVSFPSCKCRHYIPSKHKSAPGHIIQDMNPQWSLDILWDLYSLSVKRFSCRNNGSRHVTSQCCTCISNWVYIWKKNFQMWFTFL